MRRMFWFGAGIAAGVAVTRKVNETTRKATPNGMAEQLGGAVRELADAVGAFGADVRAGMTEREAEIAEVAERVEAHPPRLVDGTARSTDDRPRARAEVGRARSAGR